MVERLQRKLDDRTVGNVTRVAQPADTPPAANVPATSTDAASTQVVPTQPPGATVLSPPAPVPQDTPAEDRYRDGILIWETKDDSSIPFQLRFTNKTQFTYLNTLGVNDTFTDHLGNVRTVAKRNDVGVNREMFTLTGYIFDKRLRFNILTWTSAVTNQVVVSGSIGWQFNKAFTLTTGYWSVPGTSVCGSTERSCGLIRPLMAAISPRIWRNDRLGAGAADDLQFLTSKYENSSNRDPLVLTLSDVGHSSARRDHLPYGNARSVPTGAQNNGQAPGQWAIIKRQPLE